jgi:hypothetical protein
MSRLALMIYVIAAPTLAGIAMVAVLAMGLDTGNPVVGSVIVGALVAVPVAWFIAKKLNNVKGLMS